MRYVASFNRPNLIYRVAGKQGAYEQVRAFIAERADESGIIYCQSRKTAEGLADKLRADGVAARPYHAGLADSERASNQEQFLRDDVRCICATIAFGMGINKPNVRYVVHYDLPKNIEGYYQETGRAGRDSLPSECLLLFTAGDVVKYGRFIDEMTNEEERRVAREQLQQMVHYAECPTCRRAALLAYFGETFPPNCGGCDNCLAPRDTFDGTLAAQKFLSTVIRARQSSNSGTATFGLNHHIDVLLGLDGERIQRWQHQQLSTYGIGTEHSRAEWSGIARELIRLGYLAQITDKFTTVDVTEEGLDALRARRTITLHASPSLPQRAAAKDGGIRSTRPVGKAPVRRAGEFRTTGRSSTNSGSSAASSPMSAMFPRISFSPTPRSGTWQHFNRRPRRSFCMSVACRRKEARRLRGRFHRRHPGIHRRGRPFIHVIVTARQRVEPNRAASLAHRLLDQPVISCHIHTMRCASFHSSPALSVR